MPICHRLFFALPLPERARSAAAVYGNALSEIRSRVRNDRLHSTLAITDDHAEFPDALAHGMIDIGNRHFSEPVGIQLDEIAANEGSIALRARRKGRRLGELQAGLAGPMQRQAMLRRNWSYSPHVTLGYRPGEPWRRAIQPVEWLADEIVLIHSVVGATQHHVLGRWPLSPRQLDLF